MAVRVERRDAASRIPWYSPAYMEAVHLVRVSDKERRAIETIRKYATSRVAVLLSGKDSLVALHLALRAGVDPDVVISTYAGTRRLPDDVVNELASIARRLGARRVVIHDRPWRDDLLFSAICREYGYSTVITGLRRREGRPNRSAVEFYPWGVVINPVLDWTAAEVWSYIHHHGLPVPSPYGSSPFPETHLQRLAGAA